jgi:coenzyme F420 biosynthesis associated uncharacterized protein
VKGQNVPLKSTNLRHLGVALLLGVVAGAGVRYIATRASTSTRPIRLVDWEQARKVALRVSQWEQAPVDDRLARHDQYVEMVKRSEPLIAQYMGAQLPEPISRVFVYDRREWLEANFTSFEVVFRPIEELYAESSTQRTALGSAVGQLNSQLIGTQMGALLGFLARRVLGQYDLSLLSPDPRVRGALYFVEPNISRLQRTLGLRDEDFRLWIALHEASHVFEFEAFPWVRGYFNDLLRQFLGQMNEQIASMSGGLSKLIERLAGGSTGGKHWIELMLTPEQQQVFDRIQALMSLVEGYSNHIMNAIGEQLLPSFHEIERRVKQRQQNRPLFEELFNRVTGMDLKLAQYQQGEAFVNAVVAARGVPFANRVWERPENLPTMAEIRNPQAWIARMDG